MTRSGLNNAAPLALFVCFSISTYSLFIENSINDLDCSTDVVFVVIKMW